MKTRQIPGEPESTGRRRLYAVMAAALVVGLWLLWHARSASTFVDVKRQVAGAQPEASDSASSVLQITFWQPPDSSTLQAWPQEDLVRYGRDLIAHTAKYLGPRGSVSHTTNGMNCQNCHLAAGTKVFGNNYGSVASLYPRYRDRSGGIESIAKRVNDCIERSLHGKALDSTSTEMKAVSAYLDWLGHKVAKGSKAVGSGLKEITLLPREASARRGKLVFNQKCASCHRVDGQGQKNADGLEYVYPPLWGPNSYTDAAGLYRISNFAKFVRYNMPFGVRHDSSVVLDDEAWDVAAYVNSQPRPHKYFPNDYPHRSTKPFDHPFGPYADDFSERQHKYGPFQPILQHTKKVSRVNKK